MILTYTNPWWTMQSSSEWSSPLSLSCCTWIKAATKAVPRYLKWFTKLKSSVWFQRVKLLVFESLEVDMAVCGRRVPDVNGGHESCMAHPCCKEHHHGPNALHHQLRVNRHCWITEKYTINPSPKYRALSLKAYRGHTSLDTWLTQYHPTI